MTGSSLLPRAASLLSSPLTLDAFFIWSVTIPLRLHSIPSLEFVPSHIHCIPPFTRITLTYPECSVKSTKVNCQSHNRYKSSRRCGVMNPCRVEPWPRIQHHSGSRTRASFIILLCTYCFLYTIHYKFVCNTMHINTFQ